MTNLLIYIYVFNQSPCIQAISSCCCFKQAYSTLLCGSPPAQKLLSPLFAVTTGFQKGYYTKPSRTMPVSSLLQTITPKLSLWSVLLPFMIFNHEFQNLFPKFPYLSIFPFPAIRDVPTLINFWYLSTEL